jgi:hypothetical protein
VPQFTKLPGVQIRDNTDIRKGRRDKIIDTSEQVILRHSIVEPELIEQACLIATSPTHHRSLQGSGHGISGIFVRGSSHRCNADALSLKGGPS